MRIDKFLSNSGFGSRKEIKSLIKSGAVTVDGKIVSDSADHIDENVSDVRINNVSVSYKKHIYIMMNKPKGYISATYDKKLPVVTDLLDEYSLSFNPFPAGRLDIDTEGMLILTNDGDLCHRILSPKKHIRKKYMVISEKQISKADIELFKNGITLDDGYKTKEAILYQDEKNPLVSYITIYEGKFHQIKRMFEAVDNKVVYLKRLCMGNLSLDEGLELSQYRELTEYEIKKLCEEAE